MKIRSAWFLVLMLAAVSLAGERPNGERGNAVRPSGDLPNIVWLVSEDNSKHYLKLFDESGAETPRIARLAAEGLLFEHAFSNSPVCSVARTTLITGCYAPRIGTQFHRRSVRVPLPGNLRMFPAYLRDAGYYTTNRRKKDYNAVEGKGVWDESSGKASWRNRKEGQPFFHMQSFGASHESSLHFKPAAMKNQPAETDPASVELAPYHPDTPTFRYTYARYHDRIRRIDSQIGAVVDQLEKDKLLEDTFVFYFSDHGGVLPRSKGYVYESGLHVPLVVRIPEKWRWLVDRQRGSRVEGFVSFVDFGPTVLRLAGVRVPGEVDGVPFLGKGVTAASVDARDEAFGYADRFDEKYDLVRSLRKGRFKYLRSYQSFNIDGLQNNYRYRMLAYAQWRALHRRGELNDVQRRFFQPREPEALYDLESDPHETRNLAARPEHRETLLRLRKRLSDTVKGLPDLSFYPESVLVAEAFSSPAQFGREHRAEIASLVDIADASLISWAEAQARAGEAIESTNPWKRYWGWIVATQHGKAATGLIKRAERAAASDPVGLVRVRAAEFLALVGGREPRQTILDVLSRTPSGIETLLILNTVALLHDTRPKLDLSIRPGHIHPRARSHGQVKRRLAYFGQDG